MISLPHFWQASLEHQINRRSLLTSALLVFAARKLPLPSWITPAQAEDMAKWRHGMSTFGDLKYSTGFKKFDYVNAAAPKGGSAWQIALGTYDSFNTVVAGIKGTPARGIEQIYDTLFVAVARRADQLLRPDCRSGELSGRLSPRPLSACVPKRNGMTASRLRPEM